MTGSQEDLSILRVTNLCKAFGGIRAVNTCSFSIRRGSISGIIGPNGSGKTTLFNLITGTHKPDSGEVHLDGKRIGGLPPHAIVRIGVGRTSQNPRVFRRMTVLENMLVPTKEFRLSKVFRRSVLEEEKSRAIELLQFAKIHHLKDEFAGNLSFGQQKLLEMVTTLMFDPKLILLDEPTSGVNPLMILEMIEHIKKLNKAGVTFVIIEHNMNVVVELCEFLIALDHGQKIAEGSPSAIQANPLVLESYLGD